MIDSESESIVYELLYRLKHGKRVIKAYIGSNKLLCDQKEEELRKDKNIRYLSRITIITSVILFD